MVRMKIIPYSILFGLLVSLTLLLGISQIDAASAAPSAPPQVEPAALLAQRTVTATQPLSGTTQAVSGTLLTPVQAQPPITATGQITPTTGVTATLTATLTATPTPASQLPIVELLPDEVLTGTVVHNRSDVSVFFFLGNDLYQLPADRGVGLAMARPLAALTLFSCAAEVTDDPTCDWVSYPIRRSALYEISADAAVPGQANLQLALASAPPLDVAQIQNRTGAESTIVREDELLIIANTSTIVLDGLDETGGVVSLPRCLQTNSQRICEWLPTPLQGGIYYTLFEERGPSGINGVTIVQGRLNPLLMQEVLMTPTPTPEPEPVGIQCQAQIPSLNVRSGPGTSFSVISKLRPAEENRGQVLAVGRTADGEWLAVDPRIAEGGWVANVARWLVCEGDINDLPVMAEGGQPAPILSQPAPSATPAPPPAEEAAAEEAAAEEAAELPSETNASLEPGPEQALLIATNAFDQPIRFTLDAALHGLPEGTPSEYDLEPGKSLRFVIRAGRVQFSASTAWRNGAGNANFELGEGASRELFLRFEPSINNADQWEMRFE